jgi:hypothetical protein
VRGGVDQPLSVGVVDLGPVDHGQLVFFAYRVLTFVIAGWLGFP